MKKRLAIFGLDGARLDVIQKWISQGYLPTIEKMINNGSSGSVKTVLPGPHSFSAWTSFATGTNPGKHGATFPVVPDFKNKRLSFVDSTYIKNKKIWNYLSDAGKVVGVMDLPILYPVEEVNGIMVSSWGTPALESDYTYPKELRKEMDTFNANLLPNCYERNQASLDSLYEMTDKRFKSIKWFFEKYDWDFFVNEFIGTEMLHHIYSPFLDKKHHQYRPHFEKAVRDYYIKLDSFFKEIMDEHPDINIILMSDHGFCPTSEYIYINNILEKYNLFTRKTEMNDLKNEFYHFIVNNLTKAYLHTPNTIKRIFANLTPQFIAKKIKHNKTLNADWDTSLSLCLPMGMIYVNKACKQVLEEKVKINDISNRIIDSLKNDPFLKDKIRGIYKKEELFGGKELESLPDVIIDLKDEYRASNSTPLGKINERIDSVMSSNHTIDALFIAHGPDFKKGVKIENKSIMDITPTILYMFDVFIPAETDGKIMDEILVGFNKSKIISNSFEKEILNKAIINIRL